MLRLWRMGLLMLFFGLSPCEAAEHIAWLDEDGCEPPYHPLEAPQAHRGAAARHYYP